MIGLFVLFLDQGTINEYKFSPMDKEAGDYLCDEIKGKYYCVRRRIINKFADDKLFEDDDNLVVCTDGVCLNDQEISENKGIGFPEALKAAWREGRLAPFVNNMRGVFSGVLIDKEKRTLAVYTDHLAAKPLFYMKIENGLILSSEVQEIAAFCKMNGIAKHLSLTGAYSMLTYGYMVGNNTLLDEVKRIREGSVLIWKNGVLSIRQYHLIKTDAIQVEEEEAVNTINQLFRKAIKLQVEKNARYGYDNVIPLSAGMDCRMTSFVFRDMFDRPALNFTYSETGEYDFVEPAKMAHGLKNRWLFKSLDNGLDLMEIDEAVKEADGLIYYAWPAQLRDFLQLVNTEKWGVIHTGVLGDVIIGTFIKNKFRERYELGDGAFSKKLIEKLKQHIKIEKTRYEEGMIQNRGINGACLGYSLSFRYYAEDVSPFLNSDFMDYCLSLPYNIRQRHYLYYKWVERYYPQAMEYKHNGITPRGKLTVELAGKKYRVRAIPDLVKNTISSLINTTYGMNPHEGWYKQNQELRERMDSYFEENAGVLLKWGELYKDAVELYRNGCVKEKIQVISLLGSVKLLL